MKICGQLILLCCLALNTWANDSSYYTSGNQIIPLQETDISVKKEILTMRRIADEKVRVTVQYTFHNPGKKKSLLMGFEAAAPSGDADGTPRNGEHPYIENFSVDLNGEKISHRVSIFQTSELIEREPPYHAEDLRRPQVIPEIENVNETGFFYVYHFSATFPVGDSQITHSYDYAMSGSIFTSYEIEYLLSPALRWANQEIEDFTLIIDLGEFQQFHVLASFFEDLSSWQTQGRVKIAMQDVRHETLGEPWRVMTVWQHHGSVTFSAKNFRPKGELSLFSNRILPRDETLDVQKMELALHDLPFLEEKTIKDEFSRKALANLPYARRGYVFQNQQLRDFYEKQAWYLPDPSYKDAGLSEEERQWLAELAVLKLAK